MENIPNIEQRFEDLKTTDPRRAAEVAYAIAMLAKKEGNDGKAIDYGKKSVALFESLNLQTWEEHTSLFHSINGIYLPDLIHSDVVRDRLKPLSL